MASQVEAWWSFVMCVALVVSQMQHRACGEPQVPCHFVFGDSLSDDGNNNNLPTIAKSNYAPYGIDFPEGPTGRSSNGRTISDVIAQRLGFQKAPPPYANISGNYILKGVTYASGGAGILNETGRNLGARISLDQQLDNHRKIVSQIVRRFGNNESAARDHLAKCIYTVTIGTDDYLNNYLMPQNYSTSRQYTPVQYADFLGNRLSQQLQRLHELGARKVAVFGAGLLGCTPRVKEMNGIQGSLLCVDIVNYYITLFNKRVFWVITDLNRRLTPAKFTYIDYAGIGLTGFTKVAGFTVTSASCCKVARGMDTCIPNQTPCPNRNQYVFWDAVHPTERANEISGGRAYNAQFATDAFPYDIKKLVQL